MNPKFRMPLFSPDGGEGGATPAPVVETVTAPVIEAPATPIETPQSPVVPLRNQPPKPLIDYNPLLQQEPSPVIPVPVPVATPPVIEELDFAGRRVPVVDPVIRDIHKDYSNLQKTFQETNSAMKTLQEQNAVYENMVKTFQQGQQAPPPVAAQATVVPEAPEEVSAEDTEAFMNKWYENPKAAMKEAMQDFIKSQVDSKLQPIQQEREAAQRERQATTEIQTLSGKYGDFQDHVPAMQEILKINPQLADQGLETVYFVAKGQNQKAPVPTPTPEQLLTDPTFRSQLMSNEAFKNEMISNYLQNRTNANQQVPPVMGTQPGGNAPMMPENRPTTIREASKMFAKSLGF